MTLSDLEPLIGKPVRILKPLWDESYGEPGMYAYIESAAPDGTTVEVVLNYAPFCEYNRAREPAVWFKHLPDGTRITTTATGAGWYPKNDRETVYFDPDQRVEDYFAEDLPAPESVTDQLAALLEYGRRNGLNLAVARIQEAVA